MKVLTWNVNKASMSRSGVWKHLEQEDADIVLLQEATRVPDSILAHYHHNIHSKFPRFFAEHSAGFQTVVLSKWAMSKKPFLTSELDWVNRIHADRYGWILGCEIVDDVGTRFHVVSVHMPAFHVPWESLVGAEVSTIKLKNRKLWFTDQELDRWRRLQQLDQVRQALKNNRKLWFTEILWSLLKNADITDDKNWIVGGDFNSSIKFDKPTNRGNQEIVDRLRGLGLEDCLSHCNHGRPVETFQHTSKIVEHQLDYIYVNAPLRRRLRSARVASRADVFDRQPRLSDHLPIVCEFD